MLNWFLIKRFMFVTMSSTSISKMITWQLKVVFIHAEEDNSQRMKKLYFYTKIKNTQHIFKHARLLQLPDLHFCQTPNSSRPEVFCKKGVLKHFSKFFGKRPCLNLFFKNVAGLKPATSFKKRLSHRYSPKNFAKFYKKTLLIDYIRWLLLTDAYSKLYQTFMRKLFRKTSLQFLVFKLFSKEASS